MTWANKILDDAPQTGAYYTYVSDGKGDDERRCVCDCARFQQRGTCIHVEDEWTAMLLRGVRFQRVRDALASGELRSSNELIVSTWAAIDRRAGREPTLALDSQGEIVNIS